MQRYKKISGGFESDYYIDIITYTGLKVFKNNPARPVRYSDILNKAVAQELTRELLAEYDVKNITCPKILNIGKIWDFQAWVIEQEHIESEDKNLSEQEKLELLNDVDDLLLELGILHGDLWENNIIISNDIIYLIDFSSSSTHNSKYETRIKNITERLKFS